MTAFEGLTYRQKLQSIEKKLNFLYRQYMDLSNEMAELIKSTYEKTDEQINKSNNGQQKDLMKPDSSVHVEAATGENFELDIY